MLFVRFIFGIFAFYQDRTVYVDRKLREGKDCELGHKLRSHKAQLRLCRCTAHDSVSAGNNMCFLIVETMILFSRFMINGKFKITFIKNISFLKHFKYSHF